MNMEFSGVTAPLFFICFLVASGKENWWPRRPTPRMHINTVFLNDPLEYVLLEFYVCVYVVYLCFYDDEKLIKMSNQVYC